MNGVAEQLCVSHESGSHALCAGCLFDEEFINIHDWGAVFYVPAEGKKSAVGVVGLLEQEESLVRVEKLGAFLNRIPAHFGVAVHVAELGLDAVQHPVAEVGRKGGGGVVEDLYGRGEVWKRFGEIELVDGIGEFAGGSDYGT